MGKYLKKFELTAQYEEYINSTIASLPNISIVKDNNMIHYNHNYLKFTAEENNSTISLNAATSPDIKYSLNGGEWKQWNYNAITLNAGDNVRMKGNNSNGFSKSRNSCNQFQMTGKIGASGNIMSLLYGDDFEGNLTIPCAYCYVSMFMNCTSLTKAPALPAKILTNNCYDGMFYGCTALTTAPKLPATTLASYCYNGMFYGCTSLTTVPDLSAKILANYCCSHMFNNCSSLINAPALPATTLANDCYYGMFYNCTALTTAPELPATILADECYSNMFYNCTALTTAPELPATTLARSCYQQMFQSCSSLTTAPKLPATTLANSCYVLMFNSCSSLTTAPELPAETLVEACYQFMFGYCSKLNYIKMLATDISANSCLIGWLNGVASTGTFIKHPNMTSLSTESDSGIPRGWTVKNNIMYLTFTAEEDNSTISLNATNSPDIKYSLNGGEWTQWNYRAITLNMGDTVRMKGNNSNGFSTGSSYKYNQFSMTGKIGASGNIMSLLYEDDLEGKLTIPCTNCYRSMFKDCIALTTAPELPATTLTDSCYANMFEGCTSLTIAPELPAETLTVHCYHQMFAACTALTVAPELPAETLDEYCYYQMFDGCTSLTTAPELPANILKFCCYGLMFYGCTKLNYIKILATDISANSCLIGWLNGVASTGTFIKNSNMTSLPSGASGIPDGWVIQDFINYLKFTAEEDYSRITLNSATNPDIKYSLNGGEWTQWNYNSITLNTGDNVRMKGNNSNGFSTSDSSYNYFDMTGKISASGNIMSLLYEDDFEGNLTIPCAYCFYRMFNGSYALTTAPKLPATILTDHCYSGMFGSCSTLTAAPKLPATTLASYCYSNMFENCAALTTAPELPATTLADHCYEYMFNYCSLLTTAPELPATTLAIGCYSTMFQNCSSLITGPELPATTLADSCYLNMFNGCTSLTTAPELPATTLDGGCYLNMFSGCSSLTTAPELPATTLTRYCYYNMFSYCTKLNYIKMLATDISADSCLSGWVNKVSSTGTFIKHPNMTSLPSGPSGIPSGWTVQNAA